MVKTAIVKKNCIEYCEDGKLINVKSALNGHICLKREGYQYLNRMWIDADIEAKVLGNRVTFTWNGGRKYHEFDSHYYLKEYLLNNNYKMNGSRKKWFRSRGLSQ